MSTRQRSSVCCATRCSRASKSSSCRRRPGSSAFALLWRSYAITDSRPCVFHSPSMASESLSLACPRESNQREGHPGCQDQERPLPPSAPSPASGGREALYVAFIGWALAHRLWLFGGSPLGAARTRRKKPAGWPAGGRPVRCQAMDGLSANLRSGLAQSAIGRPRPRGCPSLWLLSLGQARESDPRAGMRMEPHTDVRRFSRRTPEQSKGTGSRLSPG